MKKTMANQRGQGLVEYLILLCLVAVSTIGVVSVLGQNIKEQYQKASAAIRGDSQAAKSVQFTKPNTNQTKKRGMNDWNESAETE